jgi:hypothetical protein
MGSTRRRAIPTSSSRLLEVFEDYAFAHKEVPDSIGAANFPHVLGARLHI